MNGRQFKLDGVLFSGGVEIAVNFQTSVYPSTPIVAAMHFIKLFKSKSKAWEVQGNHENPAPLQVSATQA